MRAAWLFAFGAAALLLAACVDRVDAPEKALEPDDDGDRGAAEATTPEVLHAVLLGQLTDHRQAHDPIRPGAQPDDPIRELVADVFAEHDVDDHLPEAMQLTSELAGPVMRGESWADEQRRTELLTVELGELMGRDEERFWSAVATVWERIEACYPDCGTDDLWPEGREAGPTATAIRDTCPPAANDRFPEPHEWASEEAVAVSAEAGELPEGFEVVDELADGMGIPGGRIDAPRSGPLLIAAAGEQTSEDPHLVVTFAQAANAQLCGMLIDVARRGDRSDTAEAIEVREATAILDAPPAGDDGTVRASLLWRERDDLLLTIEGVHVDADELPAVAEGLEVDVEDADEEEDDAE